MHVVHYDQHTNHPRTATEWSLSQLWQVVLSDQHLSGIIARTCDDCRWPAEQWGRVRNIKMWYMTQGPCHHDTIIIIIILLLLDNARSPTDHYVLHAHRLCPSIVCRRVSAWDWRNLIGCEKPHFRLLLRTRTRTTISTERDNKRMHWWWWWTAEDVEEANGCRIGYDVQ